jgi:hypothetical protein
MDPSAPTLFEQLALQPLDDLWLWVAALFKHSHQPFEVSLISGVKVHTRIVTNVDRLQINQIVQQAWTHFSNQI